MKGMLFVSIVTVICGAAFFTRPGELMMRTAANQVLQNPNTLEQGVESVGAAIGGDGVYHNDFVASRYDVKLGDTAVVGCWGAFTMTQCARPASA